MGKGIEQGAVCQLFLQAEVEKKMQDFTGHMKEKTLIYCLYKYSAREGRKC